MTAADIGGTTVAPIRPRLKVPKANRVADQQTIARRRLRDTMHQAVIDTEGEAQVQALCLEWSLDRAMPCSNLKLFVTPDDAGAAIFHANREMNILDLEWQLADAKRMFAHLRKAGDDEIERLTEATRRAENAREDAFERLIRMPAPDLRHHDYKHSKDWRCLGCREWLRTWRPEWAAVLDDEQARLNAEKEARKAARAAKLQGRA